MATLRERLDRIEDEVLFRVWIDAERMVESMSEKELEVLASTGQWPDRPEPALGTSRLDTMDRGDLIELWKENLRRFAGRNSEEMKFYALHGHWPEQSRREVIVPELKQSSPRVKAGIVETDGSGSSNSKHDL